MPVLTSHQRKALEDACTEGRLASEQAVRAALTSLAVMAERPPAHLNEEDRQLRRGLRAKARQLGDPGDNVDLLVSECAYEQWHRLLFARFLAENNLLIHPEYRAPVTLGECEELAESLGEPDGWSVAARFAAEILPGIFQLDDPCFRLRLAPEGRLALEDILAGVSAEIFEADDALGWVYQFWQKDKKDEVNASERKIGGADLGPVTQLFTEHYMVRFLLENSLGAWWAARHPASRLIEDFEYLRFDDDGNPAAGAFDGWPSTVAEVTVMDPCCGSGHFLVEAFSMLWQMRVEEEALSLIAAQDAVLRDNLFGLELDPRCVQIAMFAIALQAWKSGGGWRELPVPNIACSGIPVKAPVDDWKGLANGDSRIEGAVVRLHVLFRDADTLGSLINPKRAIDVSGAPGLQRSIEDVDWSEVSPLLKEASEREAQDPATAVLGSDATSLARAANYLSRFYTLVVTNPPFLNLTRASATLRELARVRYPTAKNELATVFVSRAAELASPGATCALVVPQNFLFLGSYRKMRESDLSHRTWHAVARIGPGGFAGISGEVVNVVLIVRSMINPPPSHTICAVDVQTASGPAAKTTFLHSAPMLRLVQSRQLLHPEARFVFGEVEGSEMLATYADTSAGIQTGDYPRFGRYFWEVADLGADWAFQQSTVVDTVAYGGREHILLWEDGKGALLAFVTEKLGDLAPSAWLRGTHFQGHRGVAVKLMGDLPVTIFDGTLFDNNVGVIMPKRPQDLPAIWAFCSSPEFGRLVRTFNPSMKAEPSAVAKVPFDAAYWRKVAETAGGLPEPWSDDPTQWLFDGHPRESTHPLQVAVIRLLGYRWPKQSASDDLDRFTDEDGIACLPSVAGEPPAANQLQQLLSRAYDQSLSPGKQQELLERAGSKKKTLGDWLRDDFFRQHCALFGHRPFVWHIWDGQRDGFAALVNYHRLDRKTLEKLTFTYLGDWIERQRAEVRDDKAGAEARLGAASKLRSSLELILDGEPPYDIYVRWKSLAAQPIGWDPDVNDGVRVNVRPFVEAGVLRSSFSVHWRKDRGKNSDDSERLNDLHLTTAEKRRARSGQA